MSCYSILFESSLGSHRSLDSLDSWVQNGSFIWAKYRLKAEGEKKQVISQLFAIAHAQCLGIECFLWLISERSSGLA